MVHKNYSSTVGLALLLMGATVAEVQFAQAQTAAFQLPASVAQGTKVRIDGSSSMAAVNLVLKQQFEQKFPGTQVNIAANGTPAGVQAVLNGKADIAAIGRPLNDAEKAQGLKTVPVGRDKIAILIGANNPFSKSLTSEQFAKIFRGEIKNWSAVGGQNAAIKFIDRPDSSDTRQAFKSYPVFKEAKFATGANALRLSEDSTKAVVANLGNNGISYATANQLKSFPGVKAVPLHGTPPTDPRYPFSQALYYVYKDGANPAVQAFLGLATNAPGQTAIERAGVAPVASVSAAKGTPVQKTNTGDQSATNSGNNAQGDNPLAFLFPGDNTAGTGAVAESGTGLPKWLWWLLPIASGAALLWMLAGGRRHRHDASGTRERGAVGTFNPPEYSADYSNRDNTVGGTPYVEGGYDPLQTNRDSTNLDTPNADLAWNTETNRTGNLDLEPNVTGNVDRSHPFGNAGNVSTGNLSGTALGGAAVGAAAAAWSTFGDRPKQSRIVLKSRSSQEVEAFWDISAEERQAMRQQGGEKLALRLYDVTDIDLAQQPAHSVQQFDCDELTQRQRLPIGLPDRDYLAEIGYVTADDQWLSLARSTHVRVPAANPFGDVARGTAVTGGTVDSPKSFLSDDRDTEVEPTINRPSETQATDPNSPTWFQRVTHHENNSANHATQASDPVVNRTSPEPQITDSQSPSWFQRITHRVTDPGNDVTQSEGAASTPHGDVLAGGATAAAGAGAATWSFVSGQHHSDAPRTDSTESTAFTTGTASPVAPDVETNTNPFVTGETFDATLSTGISEGRLVLTPRNARWAYASWDLPRSLRSRIDRNTGDNLVLRLYDVTDGGAIPPARYEQHEIDDMALSCDVPIPLSDRTYIAEVGYVDANHQWTRLARSAPAHIPAN